MPQRYTFPLLTVFQEKDDVFSAPAVYIARDNQGRVQYVGETAQGVKVRWTHHKYDKPGAKARPLYWVLNSGDYDLSGWTLEIIVYKGRKVKHHLLRTEKRLIERYQPLLNLRRP